MKDLIIKLPARAKSAIVGLWLGGCLLLAVFPPFYLPRAARARCWACRWRSPTG